MGRRKIEIRAIKDDRNRSVTFLKRKGGLFKKAHELSVLCSVEVAVIIFGSNKKLYQYSSGDIHDTLRRYQYCGPPHEQKGPADFKNRDGDDDEDEEEDGDAGSHGREGSMPPPQTQQHLMPPQIGTPQFPQNQFQHVRQPAVSASPPMSNGSFRHASPQPPVISRSNSRNEMRQYARTTMPMAQPIPPPPQNGGFTYMPNPAMYNPNVGVQAVIPPPQASPQPQFQHFRPPPHPAQSHAQMQAQHQQFLAEQQRRQPLPAQQSLGPPPIPTQRQSSPQPERSLQPSSPLDRKHSAAKSQSIFTPIDEGGSVLARHFFGAPDPPKRTSPSVELKPPPRAASQPQQPQPQPLSSPSSIPRPTTTTAEFAPPQRSNTSNSTKSGSISRPKLNLQIPAGEEEDENSPKSPSAAPNSERHNGSTMLLPPPSPSASALLSAGASGPPNPFARPPPPTSQQNSNAYTENRNSIETPISALPSRYMEQSLIASPGGMFSNWDDWAKGGLNSALLPSPLTFPTPDGTKIPPLFGREKERDGKDTDEKRKAEESSNSDAKRIKT